MTAIQVGNAPCSWGALEFEGLRGPQAIPKDRLGSLQAERIGYQQMLDELRETGYGGTELGDWGFMPTEPGALRAELDKRGLSMIGAFVQVALKHAAAHAAGEAHAVRVGRLLAAVSDDSQVPVLVLADDNATDPVRTRLAGRITPEVGLSEAEWATFARGAERVARAVRDATGLRTAFHPHSAGYIETPDEIARLLELTDPELVGLTFDTGHYLYGSGATDSQRLLADLDRFGGRIQHVHFKDCDPAVASAARRDEWDYFEALRQGLFCELGGGAVDFPAVAAWLRDRGYRGWIVVEQDVLPGMGSPRESALRNRAYLRSIGL